MFNAYSVGVSISLANKVSPVLSKIIEDFARTDKQAHDFQKRLDGIKAGFVGSFGAIGAGLSLASAFKSPIEEAEKFERAMLRIKNIGGLDDLSVMRIRSEALQGKHRGIDATESVDLFRDLHAAFGSKEEAAKFLPVFAEFARVTQANTGKNGVLGEKDIAALAKFAERRGGVKGSHDMAEQLDLAMRIQNASGNVVSPKDLLAFQSQMGAAGQLLSNDGLTQMWALMQEQGGSKAATALNSGLQNLVFGRGTEQSGVTLRKIGWVDEEANTKHLKERYGDKWGSHRNKVMANSIVDSDLAKSAPPMWMLKHGLPLINKYLDKIGEFDPAKRLTDTITFMAEGFSNRKGAESYALMATQIERIFKDYNIAQGSHGLIDSAKTLDASPLSKIQDLHARWETGLVNLGEAILPIVVPAIEKLTAALKSLNEYAEKNPDTIKLVSGAFIGLSAVLIGGGVVGVIKNTAKALGLLVDVFTVIPAAASVAAATTALEGFIAVVTGTAFLSFLTLLASLWAGKKAAEAINNNIAENSGGSISSMREWIQEKTGALRYSQDDGMHFEQAPNSIRQQNLANYINGHASTNAPPASSNKPTVAVTNIIDKNGIKSMVTGGIMKDLTNNHSGGGFDHNLAMLYPGSN